MKQCSKCDRIYSDESLQYCTEDGRTLTDIYTDNSKRKNWTLTHKLALAAIIVSGFIAMGTFMVSYGNWRMPAPPPSKECILKNDKPNELTVNLRESCNNRPCERDKETIIDNYPNGTKIRLKEINPIKNKDFTWIQIVVLKNEKTGWVAETKVDCTY